MKNYFNTLSTIEKMDQLSKCRFMNSDEFDGGVSALLNKKIVIIGCGAQGLNQGLKYERFWIEYLIFSKESVN